MNRKLKPTDFIKISKTILKIKTDLNILTNSILFKDTTQLLENDDQLENYKCLRENRQTTVQNIQITS